MDNHIDREKLAKALQQVRRDIANLHALDGGQHGMQVISYLIPAARKFLKPMGQLILEHGKQQAKDIRDLFTASRYQEIYTRQDYAGLDRLSFAQRI